MYAYFYFRTSTGPYDNNVFATQFEYTAVIDKTLRRDRLSDIPAAFVRVRSHE